MRFDQDQYIFIYQDDGTLLLLPPNPKLEGETRKEVADFDGVHYVARLMEVAKAGGGAVFYRFPHPGAATPMPKVGYAVRFQPWGWTIATGIYIDDIETVFRDLGTKVMRRTIGGSDAWSAWRWRGSRPSITGRWPGWGSMGDWRMVISIMRSCGRGAR